LEAIAGSETETGEWSGRGGGTVSLRNLRTFASFKLPAFRIYFAAMLGQMAGMNMQMMARSLLVLTLTGSYTPLGIMSLANAIPMLATSLFGGVIADRVQKKYVLLVGQASSAVISLLIALALTLGYVSEDRANSWWLLVVAALFQGSVMGLMMPSRQAIIREIVSEEDVMNAISLNTLGMNLLRLTAPAAAGFLIAGFGFQAVYYAMTGAYVVAVGFTFLLPLSSKMNVRGRGALSDIRAGIGYIRRDTTILLILIITLVAVVLSMPYMMLLPAFTEDELKVGPKGLGILMGVSGIGAIAGSLVLASLPNKKRGAMLLGMGLILGLALMAFSASTSWTLSLIVIVFVGVGQTGRMALGNTLLQYYAAADYRGRVMSFLMMEFGLSSFVVFPAAIVADIVGVRWTVGVLAFVLVLASIAAYIFIPRIRRLE
jgi:MFS family permease